MHHGGRAMENRPKKLLIFSDIHLVNQGETIIGLDPYDRFRAGLAHAISTHPDADRIILLGDLAHEGRSAQYAQLAKLLQDIDIPISFMMGNHDNRAVFLRQFPQTDVTSDGFIQQMIDLGDTCLFTLDTLDPPTGPHHAGALCVQRLAWLDQALAWANGRQIIVALHHPPFATGFTGMDRIALQNPDALYDRLTKYAGEVHLLCGHIHRTISGRAKGLSFTIFKSTCDQMPMLLGEAGSAHSVAEPGAYGIVLADNDGIIVHTEDFTLENAAPTLR